MKNIFKFLFTFILGNITHSISFAQTFQGSIAKGAGANQVDVFLKSTFPNATNEFVNGATISISVPITTNLAANIVGVGDFSTSSFSFTAETIGSESLFEWVITRNTIPSPYIGWATGVPFKIATITFSGNTGFPSPTSLVKLLDRTDVTTLNGYFTFSTTNGGDKTNYANKFYSMSGSGTPVVTNINNQYVQTSNTIVLPIILVSFTAAKVDTDVNLNWIVSSEENAYGYDVERSAGNGSAFKAIAHLAANNKGKYSSTDASPLDGANYYRVKMVDKDSQFKYSEVRYVLFDGKTVLFDIYPNPVVTNTLYLHLQQNTYEGKAQAIITDLAGRNILSTSIILIKGNNQLPLAVKFLNKGTYFVTVYETGGTSITDTKKFVIQ